MPNWFLISLYNHLRCPVSHTLPSLSFTSFQPSSASADGPGFNNSKAGRGPPGELAYVAWAASVYEWADNYPSPDIYSWLTSWWWRGSRGGKWPKSKRRDKKRQGSDTGRASDKKTCLGRKIPFSLNYSLWNSRCKVVFFSLRSKYFKKIK